MRLEEVALGACTWSEETTALLAEETAELLEEAPIWSVTVTLNVGTSVRVDDVASVDLDEGSSVLPGETGVALSGPDWIGTLPGSPFPGNRLSRPRSSCGTVNLAVLGVSKSM